MAYLCTFFSVSDALYFEKVLGAQGVTAKVIPVPRELSSSCGYAVQFDTDELNGLADMITSNGIEVENTYQVTPSSGKTAYTLCGNWTSE